MCEEEEVKILTGVEEIWFEKVVEKNQWDWARSLGIHRVCRLLIY